MACGTAVSYAVTGAGKLYRWTGKGDRTVYAFDNKDSIEVAEWIVSTLPLQSNPCYPLDSHNSEWVHITQSGYT